MDPNTTRNIHAIVSIFTHFAGADSKITDEEILFIFASVRKYFGQHDKVELTVKISAFMKSPLSLREAIDIVKAHPELALSLVLQSTLLIYLDQDIDFFEETVLRVVSKELFNTEVDSPIEELIAKLKQSLKDTKTEEK